MKEALEELLLTTDAYQQAADFLAIVKHELEICESFLSPEISKLFRRYYQNRRLENADDYRLSYLQNQYAPKLQYLIDSSKPGSKVLDAGCGLGTESILSGILGSEVMGVDIKIERLSIAEKRLKFYQQQLDRPLNVSFNAQSVINVSGNFDVIWSEQSISHIDPAEEFIQFCHDHLVNGGKLIVSDSNALNPVVYFNAKMEQRKWREIGITKKDPATGNEIRYAHERLFSVHSIKRLVRNYGFHVERLTTYGYLPLLPLAARWKKLAYYSNRLDKVPLIRFLAAGYTVVAVRQ